MAEQLGRAVRPPFLSLSLSFAIATLTDEGSMPLDVRSSAQVGAPVLQGRRPTFLASLGTQARMLGVQIRLHSEVIQYWDSDDEPAVVLVSGEVVKGDVSPSCSPLTHGPSLTTWRSRRSSSSQTACTLQLVASSRRLHARPWPRSARTTRSIAAS